MKEFDVLKNIDQTYYCSDFYDDSLNKFGVKCGTLLRVWENKGWINKQDPYGWFQWYFRYYLKRRSKDDKSQIKRWKGIVSRFKGIVIKMILIEILIVDLMIIIFHLRLDRFYYIGIMN